MHAALEAMLTETIQWQQYVSQDAYGLPVYAAAIPRSGRVEYSTREVVDGTGHHRVSTTRVYLAGDLPIDLRDRLTLPDGTRPPIQVIVSPRDIDGSISHHELAL